MVTAAGQSEPNWRCSMGLFDKLSSGLDRVAQEAEKAVEQGRSKVEELQVERQMDQVARRLGYLEYEAHKAGSAPDATKRSELLEELRSLEGQLAEAREKVRAEAESAGGGGESEAEKAVGWDETAVGPEEVTGIDLPEQAEDRLKH